MNGGKDKERSSSTSKLASPTKSSSSSSGAAPAAAPAAGSFENVSLRVRHPSGGGSGKAPQAPQLESPRLLKQPGAILEGFYNSLRSSSRSSLNRGGGGDSSPAPSSPMKPMPDENYLYQQQQQQQPRQPQRDSASSVEGLERLSLSSSMDGLRGGAPVSRAASTVNNSSGSSPQGLTRRGKPPPLQLDPVTSHPYTMGTFQPPQPQVGQLTMVAAPIASANAGASTPGSSSSRPLSSGSDSSSIGGSGLIKTPSSSSSLSRGASQTALSAARAKSPTDSPQQQLLQLQQQHVEHALGGRGAVAAAPPPRGHAPTHFDLERRRTFKSELHVECEPLRLATPSSSASHADDRMPMMLPVSSSLAGGGGGGGRGSGGLSNTLRVVSNFTALKEDEISVSKDELVQILAANQHNHFLVHRPANRESPAAEGWIPGHVLGVMTSSAGRMDLK